MTKTLVATGLNKITRPSKNASNAIHMIWLPIIGKINPRRLPLKKAIMASTINQIPKIVGMTTGSVTKP